MENDMFISDPVNKDYRLSNFYVAKNNKLILNAIKSIVINEFSELGNIFYLGGNLATGKTHLLSALYNEMNHLSGPKTYYTSSHTLIRNISKGIITNNPDAFEKLLMEFDIIIIDDIDYLYNKEKTQQVLCRMLDRFLSAQKTIFISSAIFPDDFKQFHSRLKSRLYGSTLLNLFPMDYQSRYEFICNYSKGLKLELDTSLIEVIAHHLTSDARALKGIINCIKHISLSDAIIDTDIVDKLIQKYKAV